MARTTSNTSGSSVNIYVSPLGDVTRHHDNLFGSSTSSTAIYSADTISVRRAFVEDMPPVKYPSSAEVLRDLHQFFPLLDYPSYGAEFIKNGIIYANTVLSLDTSYFVDIVGMPRPIVQDFIDHATRLVIRAEKGKGSAETNAPPSALRPFHSRAHRSRRK